MESLRRAEVDYAIGMPELTGDCVGRDVKDGGDLFGGEVFRVGSGRGSHEGQHPSRPRFAVYLFTEKSDAMVMADMARDLLT